MEVVLQSGKITHWPHPFSIHRQTLRRGGRGKASVMLAQQQALNRQHG